MAKKIKYIAFIFIITLLALPALQGAFKLFTRPALHGDFIPVVKPELSLGSWFEMKYQNDFEPYLEENIGFHSDLVRLNNQLDFSLFSKPNAEGVVVGKDRQLYEEDYIRAWLGKDFVGYNIVDRKARRIKFLQEHLKREFDIDLIIILEPGKASVYPEYIPDHYNQEEKSTSNYQAYLHKFDQYQVRYMDLNKYFMDNQDQLAYPVFTRNGIHWSIYAMTYAADKMLKYIENIREIELPGVKIDNWIVTDQPQKTDNDVSKTLNLIWEPKMDTTAYPEYEFAENAGKEKPMVLVIGDSFYWNFFNTRIPKHLFNNEAFWYFYKKVYPESYTEPISVSDLDLQVEIEKQDVIILTVTERFQFNFDWGFIDDLYRVYTPLSPYENVYSIQNDIVKFSEWFNAIIHKAQLKKISLESMLYMDALYTFEISDPLAYFSLFGPDHYKNAISNDSEWLKAETEKAKAENKSISDILPIIAESYFKYHQPEASKKYYAVQAIIDNIKNDSLWLEHVQLKADKYYIPLEEMLLIDAEYMYNLDK